MALQHPVPEPMLARIGDVTVSFALLEFTVQMLAMTLLEQDARISRIVTAELSFRGLRDLVASLYRERHGDGDGLDALHALLARAGHIEERRNQITHSVWAAGPRPGTITRIKTRARVKHGLDIRFDTLTEGDLTDFSTEIRVLAGDVQALDLDLRQ